MKSERLKTLVMLLGVGMILRTALAADPVPKPATLNTARADSATVIKSQMASGEGELIQLEDVQIKGEIAQPNVAITVSRAQPLFREITLEHTTAEGLSDLDLSGLREGPPPPEKIHDWKEIVKRPRR